MSGGGVILQFTREAAVPGSVMTLQHSGTGQDWQPLAVSTDGGAFVPVPDAEVVESGAALVTVSAPRTAARQMYRLSRRRTP